MCSVKIKVRNIERGGKIKWVMTNNNNNNTNKSENKKPTSMFKESQLKIYIPSQFYRTKPRR